MKRYFFSWIDKHLEKNPLSAVLFSDLGFPQALDTIAKFPDRAINVGVCEQNAAVVAKGLCSEGFEVFIYGVSSFTLWRSAEALKLYFTSEDRLRVIGNGGGYGYGIMGTTHHSLDDLGLIRLWPAWSSWIPRYDQDLPTILDKISQCSGPQYLRMTNNPRPSAVVASNDEEVQVYDQGSSLTVVTLGPLSDVVLRACAMVKEVTVFVLQKWPQKDLSAVRQSVQKSQRLLVVEEHQQHGGLAEQLLMELKTPMMFVESLTAESASVGGSREFLLEMAGLTEKNIAQKMIDLKNRK